MRRFRDIEPRFVEPFLSLRYVLKWEESKFSRIVSKDEIVRNDYNISPSRYIHVAEAEKYRPIEEILAELEELEKEAEKTNKVLMQILGQFR